MISLQHVSKTYRNGVTALEGVDVEVEKGEFVFIVGQSGSGKSTMIRLLLNEEEATKGDIYVARQAPRARCRRGTCPSCAATWARSSRTTSC